MQEETSSVSVWLPFSFCHVFTFPNTVTILFNLAPYISIKRISKNAV